MAKENRTINTPEFRLAFPNVFEPSTFGNNEKYIITMLFPKDEDLSKLKALARDACVDEWGVDQKKWPKFDMPFGNGDDKEWAGFAGHTFVRATSQYKPGIVDINLEEVIDKSRVYGGCYARAQINAFTWEYAGKAGVSFGLMNLQLLRDGEPFGGGGNPAAVFDDGEYTPPKADGEAPPEGDIFS